jgi:hypothetical protein
MKGKDGYTEIKVSILEDDIAKVKWNAEKAAKLALWMKEREASFGSVSKAVESAGYSCSRAQVQKLAENRTPEVYYDVAKSICEHLGYTYAHLGMVVMVASSN